MDQPTVIRPFGLGHVSNLKDDSMVTSTRILSIISKFRLTSAADAHDRWVEGTPKFLFIIDNFVKMGKPVRMCLPAFPCKSADKE